MELHENARSCPRSRMTLVHRVRCLGWRVSDAARAAGLSERRAYVWLRRFKEEGLVGLRDRSSRPNRSPAKGSEQQIVGIVQLRLERKPVEVIAHELGTSVTTVGRVLRQRGLSRLKSLDPVEPPNRYEHDEPGALLHLDIKKLGRIDGVGHRFTGHREGTRKRSGWEFLHVAIDDHSRWGYCEILPTESKDDAVCFLRRAIQFFAELGVTVQALLTDNGGCYVSGPFHDTCEDLGIKHRRTRPYRPRTNGKAERFIQTLLREWAYRFVYTSSKHRSLNLPRYLGFYNLLRPHSSLLRKPPIPRLDMNDLMAIHT